MKLFKVPVFILLVFCSIIAHSTPLSRMNILVYPFSNAGSPQFSWISAGMTDTVIADLMRLNSINVFSDDDRKKAIREIELGMTGIMKESDAPTMGRIMGANLIFTGSYTVTGKSIRVIAKLIEVETTKVQKSRKIDGTLDAIAELEDRIVASLIDDAESVAIKGIVPPKFSAQERHEAGKGYNPPPGAYELYGKALELSEKNPREALKLALQAVKESPGYPSALILAGLLSGNLGDNTGAARHYFNAKNALENIGLSQHADYALLLQNMALTDWNRGSYTAAVENSLRAKTIWDNLGRQDTPAYASMLVVLGAAYRQMGDNNNGLKFTEEGRKTLERAALKKSSSYAWALSNLGVIHQNLGAYQKTLDAYKEALEIWETLGMKKSMGYAFTYSQVGGTYYMMGDYNRALDYYLKGIAMCDDLGLQGTVQYAYYAWTAANSYWMTGRFCDGVPYMRKAVAAFTALGHAETDKARKALDDFTRKCGK